MNTKKMYLTQAGFTKIQDELTHLINVRRPDIADKLHKAISHGDLSENADYDYAKQEQAIVEGRIQALEDALRNVEIISEEECSADCVRIGSFVTVVEDGWDEEETYRIVGVHEADPAEGLISDESPIGLALLGKKVGEITVALTPGGQTAMRIAAIQ